MGIPGFYSRTRRYTHRIEIGRTGEDSRARSKLAIIDGPSLAHFSYYTAQYDSLNHGLLPAIDYDRVGQAAMAFLDNLISYGFKLSVTMYTRDLELWSRD